MVDELEEGMVARCEELISSGECERALECADELVQLKPADGISWYIKGRALFEADRFEEALQCLDKAVDLSPDQYQTWHARGLVLIALGKFENAIKDFEKAVSLEASDVDAVYAIGACYIMLENEEKAIEWVGRAAELDLQRTYELAEDFYEHVIVPAQGVEQGLKEETRRILDEIKLLLEIIAEEKEVKGTKLGDVIAEIMSEKTGSQAELLQIERELEGVTFEGMEKLPKAEVSYWKAIFLLERYGIALNEAEKQRIWEACL